MAVTGSSTSENGFSVDARPTDGNNAASQEIRGELMEWKAFEDKQVPGSWRVEAIDFDDEGNVYVTIFSGPQARERAEEYASWKNSSEREMFRKVS